MPASDGVELLRIYKHGSSSYSEITSATVGGFSGMQRVQVLNDAGSLDFTLAGTTAAQLAGWLDEAATVEYWENGAKVASYSIDAYTFDWASATCDVQCVGKLALGKSPGSAYTGPLCWPLLGDVHAVATDTVANIMRDVVQSPTFSVTQDDYYVGWNWDDAKGYGALGILVNDDFRYADHKYHADAPPPGSGMDADFLWRYESLPAGGWENGGEVVAPSVTGSMGAEITGTQVWQAYYDGCAAISDMYVQGSVMGDPGLADDALSTQARYNLIARRVSSSLFFMCRFSPTTVQFFYKLNTTYTQIGTNTTIPTLNARDIIGFSTIGTTLTAFVNGVAVKTATSSAVVGPGYGGLRGEVTAGDHTVAFTSFCVTTGAVPPLYLDAGFGDVETSDIYQAGRGAARADVLQQLASAAGLTFWLDEEDELNIERYRTDIDRTYTVNGTLHGFETTYSARDVVNQISIDRGPVGLGGEEVYSEHEDAASVASYGLRHADVSEVATTDASAAAYASVYFSQNAQPRLSAKLLVDHDPTLRPGLRVAVTGLGDGRTYSDLIQQITHETGDLWDELVTGTPALALKG